MTRRILSMTLAVLMVISSISFVGVPKLDLFGEKAFAGEISYPKVDSISTNGSSTIAVDENGKVWSWGYNDKGVLGFPENAYYGNYSSIAYPASYANLTNIKKTAIGNSFSMFLTKDGKVYTAGDNNNGQRGQGNANSGTYDDVVTLVPNLNDDVNVVVVDIAASQDYALVLKSDGTVWYWGYAFQNGMDTQYSPTVISGLTGIVSISAENAQCLALDTNGNLYYWGGDSYGFQSLGYYISPVLISSSIKQAVVTNNSTIAVLTIEGYVKTIGNVDCLGNGSYESTVWGFVKTDVNTNFSNVKGIAAGSNTMYAYTNDGKGYAWGGNSFGLLGNGTQNSSVYATQIKSDENTDMTDVDEIFAGNNSAYVKKADGSLFALGEMRFLPLKYSSYDSKISAFESLNYTLYPTRVIDFMTDEEAVALECDAISLQDFKFDFYGTARYDNQLMGGTARYLKNGLFGSSIVHTSNDTSFAQFVAYYYDIWNMAVFKAPYIGEGNKQVNISRKVTRGQISQDVSDRNFTILEGNETAPDNTAYSAKGIYFRGVAKEGMLTLKADLQDYSLASGKYYAIEVKNNFATPDYSLSPNLKVSPVTSSYEDGVKKFVVQINENIESGNEFVTISGYNYALSNNMFDYINVYECDINGSRMNNNETTYWYTTELNSNNKPLNVYGNGDSAIDTKYPMMNFYAYEYGSQPNLGSDAEHFIYVDIYGNASSFYSSEFTLLHSDSIEYYARENGNGIATSLNNTSNSVNGRITLNNPGETKNLSFEDPYVTRLVFKKKAGYEAFNANDISKMFNLVSYNMSASQNDNSKRIYDIFSTKGQSFSLTGSKDTGEKYGQTTPNVSTIYTAYNGTTEFTNITANNLGLEGGIITGIYENNEYFSADYQSDKLTITTFGEITYGQERTVKVYMQKDGVYYTTNLTVVINTPPVIKNEWNTQPEQTNYFTKNELRGPYTASDIAIGNNVFVKNFTGGTAFKIVDSDGNDLTLPLDKNQIFKIKGTGIGAMKSFSFVIADSLGDTCNVNVVISNRAANATTIQNARPMTYSNGTDGYFVDKDGATWLSLNNHVYDGTIGNNSNFDIIRDADLGKGDLYHITSVNGIDKFNGGNASNIEVWNYDLFDQNNYLYSEGNQSGIFKATLGTVENSQLGKLRFEFVGNKQYNEGIYRFKVRAVEKNESGDVIGNEFDAWFLIQITPKTITYKFTLDFSDFAIGEESASYNTILNRTHLNIGSMYDTEFLNVCAVSYYISDYSKREITATFSPRSQGEFFGGNSVFKVAVDGYSDAYVRAQREMFTETLFNVVPSGTVYLNNATLRDTNTNQNSNIVLTAGNVVSDSFTTINSVDLNGMLSAIGKKASDADWNEYSAFDLNGNGLVNAIDLARVLKNYNASSSKSYYLDLGIMN